MSRFLPHLLARWKNPEPSIQPRLPSRFEGAAPPRVTEETLEKSPPSPAGQPTAPPPARLWPNTPDPALSRSEYPSHRHLPTPPGPFSSLPPHPTPPPPAPATNGPFFFPPPRLTRETNPDLTSTPPSPTTPAMPPTPAQTAPFRDSLPSPLAARTPLAPAPLPAPRAPAPRAPAPFAPAPLPGPRAPTSAEAPPAPASKRPPAPPSATQTPAPLPSPQSPHPALAIPPAPGETPTGHTVHITIGRVEIRAAPLPNTPSIHPPSSAPAAARGPAVPLAEYLRRRDSSA
jgi:hypothetical protein